MTDKHVENKSLFLHKIKKFIMQTLYFVSMIYVGIGVGVLLMILFNGEIHIENGSVLALWILLFFPLRNMYNRLK